MIGWMFAVTTMQLYINLVSWGRSFLHYKEKVFVIEKILNKACFPDYQTIWHYESKIAQTYLFKYYAVQSPNTFVSFDYKDSLNFSETAELPIVFKESHGAGGSKVSLLTYRSHLKDCKS